MSIRDIEDLYQQNQYLAVVCGRRSGATTWLVNTAFEEAWKGHKVTLVVAHDTARESVLEMIRFMAADYERGASNAVRFSVGKGSVRIVTFYEPLFECTGAIHPDGTETTYPLPDRLFLDITGYEREFTSAGLGRMTELFDTINGKIVIIGNGFGATGYLFHELSQGAHGYVTAVLKTSDNPYVSPDVLKEIQERTDPRVFAAEYEGAFTYPDRA